MDFCFLPGYIPLLDVVIQMFSTWMFSGQYLCAFNSQDSEELLEGMVKNLGWLPILVQEGTHSLFPAFQLRLPADHPVTVSSPRKYLPTPTDGTKRGCAIP